MSEEALKPSVADPRDTALFVSAFFDELMRAGVHDVVVSPGSRSTPLSMVALEASTRWPQRMRLYLDVDERGAAFFALGLAKATQRAVCVICTSGTAVGNYYPAVMEAESSRVPLMVLSGDRPLRLQGLGAPQTLDQQKAFGGHVRRYFAMPEPASTQGAIAFARQVAKEAVIAAAPGTHSAAPVHVNFPFEEPLKPNLAEPALFTVGRCSEHGQLPARVLPELFLAPADARTLARYVHAHKAIALCGEGTFSSEALVDPVRREREMHALAAWSQAFDVPLLADPLSQLRSYSEPAIIDHYDSFMGTEAMPEFDTVIRFGRYPVSKPVTKTLEAKPHTQIVVDVQETRDFNAATTTFVAANPIDFAVALLDAHAMLNAATAQEQAVSSLTPCCNAWEEANTQAAALANEVVVVRDSSFEGAYVRSAIDAMPEGALLFTANSMSVRAVDAFYSKGAPLTVLANRGLNGIDGTVSSAIGAAQAFDQTVFLTGDLTMIHDMNALALQNEMMLREGAGAKRPGVVIVLLNNAGGAIFDMLPQKSDEAYFERLFLTPHTVDFQHAAATFGVPYSRAVSLDEFDAEFNAALGKPGIHMIEVKVPLQGVRERYARYK